MHRLYQKSLLSFVLGTLFLSCTPTAPEPTDEPPVDRTTATFPHARWEKIDKPEDVGFSSSKLDLVAYEYIKHQSAALLVVYKGKILYQRGDIDHKYKSHSLRKSFLSALYGNYVKNGDINLLSTMADLLIDDDEGLSDTEKQATVRDLIMARSGIYHPAHYESEGMTNQKPDRYSHDPGEFWYYNNWDFNALGTIFIQQTGKDIFEAIEEEFAIPLQMDFKTSDGWYATTSGISSRHKAYPFRISASDLARFGLLMLNKGKWKNQQIIPADWVTESTRSYSDASVSNSSGYGYMWWINDTKNPKPLLPNVSLPNGAFMASGVGGQVMLVIPDYDMVITHRVDTDADHSVSNANIGKLFQLILDARL
ncbi:serine hydrolase [Sphingobacterium sp. SGG-5]|uniref:serine hydrolase domain-containing protein n=1 Tax=Sphingobacterium sp. SGG-5 TaxID=2710881 RepID=UPI0013EDD088|nr:serine hydrolase [Sphingobacterium sp. SGG-5]NGM60662.1 serine hydrolase [Sphingobacterium sp. SGG-5]